MKRSEQVTHFCEKTGNPKYNILTDKEKIYG